MKYFKFMKLFFVLCVACIRKVACENSRTYIAVADSGLQNSMSVRSVRSVIACGVACSTIDCVAYSFSQATKTCIMVSDTSFAIVTSPGSTLYVQSKDCKEGWKKFSDSCYLFTEESRSWESSKLYCESVGATLVKVESYEEHQFIRQTIASITSPVFFWIGARYNSTAGEHRLIDGTPITFNGWYPGKPGSTQGCVDYLGHLSWTWNSHWDCYNTPGPHICEAYNGLTPL